MNPVASWMLAFLLTAVTAVTLLVGDRKTGSEPVLSRDPASLSEIETELILNRIREGDLVAIKGDMNSAKSIWKVAREKGAGYWPMHETLGDSLARHGLDAEATLEYETANRISAGQLGRAPAPLCLKQAGLFLRLKRPEPALRMLIECGSPVSLAEPIGRILRESPGLLEIVKHAAETRDPRLWAIVASETPDSGDKASAFGKYARSVAPGDGALSSRAVNILREAKRVDEALQVAAAWSKAAPSSIDAYESWGRLLAESGDRKKALLTLSTMVDIKPGDPEAHRRLGIALRDLNEFPGAIVQFGEAARLRPEDSSIAEEIFLTQLAQGNFDAAVIELNKLSSKNGASLHLKQMIADEAMRRIDLARKAGDMATVAKLRRWCGELGIAEVGLYDIKIVMKWDAASDVDLDVTEPKGEVINHGNPRSRNGAVYPFDNTQGRGPEHYTLFKAPPGKYRVGVHLHGQTRSIAEIDVILFEETPRERRLTARVELNAKTAASWPIEFDIP